MCLPLPTPLPSSPTKPCCSLHLAKVPLPYDNLVFSRVFDGSDRFQVQTIEARLKSSFKLLFFSKNGCLGDLFAASKLALKPCTVSEDIANRPETPQIGGYGGDSISHFAKKLASLLWAKSAFHRRFRPCPPLLVLGNPRLQAYWLDTILAIKIN